HGESTPGEHGEHGEHGESTPGEHGEHGEHGESTPGAPGTPAESAPTQAGTPGQASSAPSAPEQANGGVSLGLPLGGLFLAALPLLI
ncbi:hypothetical protein B0I75DRAFT_169517, partial [Yarrowia lipolytica]